MSFTQKATNAAGQTKTVVADSEAELKDAVKAVENENKPVTVDINVPVPKGRDLLVVEEDGVTQGLADGRGAHNSPRSAVADDGNVEGDPKVPYVVSQRDPVTAEDQLQKLGKDGKLSDLTDADRKKADEATNPTNTPS